MTRCPVRSVLQLKTSSNLHNSCVLHIVTVVWTINYLQSISPEQRSIVVMLMTSPSLFLYVGGRDSHSHLGRTSCLVDTRMMQWSHFDTLPLLFI